MNKIYLPQSSSFLPSSVGVDFGPSSGGFSPVSGGLSPISVGATSNPAGSLLGSVGGGIFSSFTASFSNNIASVFANGFDFSCWRSTYPSDKVQKNISAAHQPVIQRLMVAIQNATSASQAEFALNRLAKEVYNNAKWYEDMQNGNRWSKCSSKGIAVYQQLYAKTKGTVLELVKGLKSVYNVSQGQATGRTVRASYHLKNDHYDNKPFTYPVFKITSNTPSIANVFSNGTGSGGSVKLAGTNPLIALAIGGFIFSKLLKKFK